jgi:hypothetical protein
MNRIKAAPVKAGNGKIFKTEKIVKNYSVKRWRERVHMQNTVFIMLCPLSNIHNFTTTSFANNDHHLIWSLLKAH